MKENKLFGHFTNESIQKAYRNANKATLTEAVISVGVLYLTGIAADATYEHILKPAIEKGKDLVINKWFNKKEEK